MSTKTIRALFAGKIDRRIEEVIKVDQTDEAILKNELEEYVVTDSIGSHYTDILDCYLETRGKPHEGIAVWISGFFGSGKSSFAKYLGLALENRDIEGQGAAEIFGQRTGNNKVQSLLRSIPEQMPTHAVIFDVSTDRGIRTGNQTLTEIMYRLLLQSLGYARDLDLSELEITLEAEGELDRFEAKYRELFGDRDWNREKGKIAIAVQQASRVMHALDEETYPSVDSWRDAAMQRADITPRLLAERCLELLARRGGGKEHLVFVIDEVGQFVARDVQKMLDLQAVVQNVGRLGRGKIWIVVTSQESLKELVDGLDERRVELARLMDRFPIEVHLEPSDISEVTSRRVLSKNKLGEEILGPLFEQHRGRLTGSTRLSADFRLPELERENFIDLYPLLPYQVDLIIDVVSGLRQAGGASKHVGGANRTIIKLAQQLLIRRDVDLASQPVGALARLDQVYDLVSGNIPSEVRAKISSVSSKVDHPLAQKVAKTICLLEFVKSLHRSPENLAAALHPAIDADSQLPDVKAALEELEAAHLVRRGDDGYRIPTPAEDDWEQQRRNLRTPRGGEMHRLHADVITGLWTPQPSHRLLDVQLFKAGLVLDGRSLVDGDVTFHLALVDDAGEMEERVEEGRRRSRDEPHGLFWVAALGDAVEREATELFRSREILSRKERSARTKDETRLVEEEKRRQRRHQEELRRLLKLALLQGSIFFRGNDRSPDDSATEVARTAARALALALPQVFDRFEDAAAQPSKKQLEALMVTESLRGLPPVFTELRLIRDEGGQPVFQTDSGPLAEVFGRVEDRTSFGEVASGRFLTDELAREPFGWSFDVVRLLTVSLLRAGKIEATSKGQVITDALSLDARNTFLNNNLFRQASFRPKESLDFPKVVEAYEHFQTVFGDDISELNEPVVAREIKQKIGRLEEPLRQMETLLARHDLPGAALLEEAVSQVRTVRGGSDENAILAFNAAYREIKDAITRANQLENALTEPRLHDLARARLALGSQWAFLESEPGTDPALHERARELRDLLGRETFFRELPEIEQHTRALEEAYTQCFDQAVIERTHAYSEALEELRSTPGWEKLESAQREHMAAALRHGISAEISSATPIAQIRAETDACGGRLRRAIEETLRLVDGKRLVQIRAAPYFAGGIETVEQLDEALDGLRQECERLIAADKKVLVQ